MPTEEDHVEISTEDPEAAAAAKGRGAKLFADKKYAEAVLEYEEAEKFAPTEHVFASNICACHLEIAKSEWEPAKKLEQTARALSAARRCATLDPSWLKGWLRMATAEADCLAASELFEKRKRERKEPVDYEGKPWPEPPASLLAVIESASHSSCESSCRTGLELECSNAPLRLQLQKLRDAGHVDNEEADRKLMDAEAAAPLKAQGNTHFSAKRYEEAAESYTAALSFNSMDHIFYSNRSACYAGLDDDKEAPKALHDADRCIALNPTFVKGHSRRSAALFGLGRYVEAEAAAAAGLALDEQSGPLKELLAAAQVETAESPAVQARMHTMRVERARNEKMKKMLKGLNMGGGVQMFSPGSLGGMGGMGGAGGGMGGLEGLFGGGGNLQAPAQSDAQMRQMARAVAGATGGDKATSQNPLQGRSPGEKLADDGDLS